MKAVKLILVISFLINNFVFAQYFNKDYQTTNSKKNIGLFDNWKERIFFGGNVGLSFSENRSYLYLEASPLVGYRITDRLSVGSTISYIYLKQTIQYLSGSSINSLNYRSHIFGASPFSRFFILDWLFLHAEYDMYSGDLIKTRDAGPDYYYTERGFISYPLVGAGATFNIGRRGGIIFMILYNPLYENVKDKFPIYTSPIVPRLGFFF